MDARAFALRDRLLPESIATLVFAGDLEEVSDQLGDPILLFRVEDPDGELAEGLAESTGLEGDRLAPRVERESSTITRTLFRPRELMTSPMRPLLTPDSLRDLLRDSVHYVVPLRRRRLADRPVQQQVSVGRAAYNDIVLRHSTVSSVHAWLECDDAEAFYVSDVKSLNATHLNDELVNGQTLILAEGDTIHFGSVAALVASPDLLWRALH